MTYLVELVVTGLVIGAIYGLVAMTAARVGEPSEARNAASVSYATASPGMGALSLA